MKTNRLLFIAFLMVLAGAVLPFLMVIKVVPSTFLLNFIAYGISIGGLFLGVIGTAHYVRRQDRGDYHR